MEEILVIEDDQGIRETLEDILELSGYQVTSAKDGQEGLDFILQQRHVLVLCDIGMPKLNGFEVLATMMEKISEDKRPFFIFLSATVEKSEIEHGIALGANDYLMKPFDSIELLSTIDRLLKEKI